MTGNFFVLGWLFSRDNPASPIWTVDGASLTNWKALTRYCDDGDLAIGNNAAGIRCMGLAHSRTAENLEHADWAFHGFEDVDLEAIAKEFE